MITLAIHDRISKIRPVWTLWCGSGCLINAWGDRQLKLECNSVMMLIYSVMMCLIYCCLLFIHALHHTCLDFESGLYNVMLSNRHSLDCLTNQNAWLSSSCRRRISWLECGTDRICMQPSHSGKQSSLGSNMILNFESGWLIEAGLIRQVICPFRSSSPGCHSTWYIMHEGLTHRHNVAVQYSVLQWYESEIDLMNDVWDHSISFSQTHKALWPVNVMWYPGLMYALPILHETLSPWKLCSALTTNRPMKLFQQGTHKVCNRPYSPGGHQSGDHLGAHVQPGFTWLALQSL